MFGILTFVDLRNHPSGKLSEKSWSAPNIPRLNLVIQVRQKKPWPHCLEAQVVVPVFQRGYCWEEKQLHGWWEAVITVWKTPSHQPAKELKYYRGLRVWKKESSNLVWQKYWRRRKRTVTPVISIRVALEGSAWTMIRLFALTDNRGSQRPPCWLPQSGDSSQNAL